MASASTAVQLLSCVEKFSAYYVYVGFATGFIGNLLLVLVLILLKIFRQNRSSFYLIVESICSSILLTCHLIDARAGLYSTTGSLWSLIWCKLRTPIGQSCRLIVCSTICFQSMDQFCSTHPRHSLRRFSTLQIGRWLIAVASIIAIGQTIPYAIFNRFVPHHRCSSLNAPLNRYYSYFYYPILQGLLPMVAATSFSLLAYRNVRRFVRRQIPFERRRLDRQFTAMIFARVLCFVICNTPYTIYRIYLLTANISSDNLEAFAVSQLILSIVALFSLLNHVVRHKRMFNQFDRDSLLDQLVSLLGHFFSISAASEIFFSKENCSIGENPLLFVSAERSRSTHQSLCLFVVVIGTRIKHLSNRFSPVLWNRMAVHVDQSQWTMIYRL